MTTLFDIKAHKGDIGGSICTPYKFNGKERDDETGYYYYGARYYDPGAARWFGTDPPAHKYPMNSPYVYCNGNPVRFVDLDGREITDADDWKAFGKDMYEVTTAMLSVGLQLAANIEVGKSKSVGVVLNGSSIDIVGVREGKFTPSKDSPTVSQEASLGSGAISLQAKKEIRTNADGAMRLNHY